MLKHQYIINLNINLKLAICAQSIFNIIFKEDAKNYSL